MREALSGTSSQRFTVSPASISIFWGFVVWFWGVFVLGFFVLVLVCVCVFVCVPPTSEIF